MFQLKRARSYAEEKTSTTNLTESVDYKMYRCKDFPNLIRMPTRPNHVNHTAYNPVIKFAHDEILEWQCDCPIGNVLSHCCSHVASAIQFLSFEQWQVHQRRMSSSDLINIATDAGQLSDFYDSPDGRR